MDLALDLVKVELPMKGMEFSTCPLVILRSSSGLTSAPFSYWVMGYRLTPTEVY